jgi:hypothetical protein
MLGRFCFSFGFPILEASSQNIFLWEGVVSPTPETRNLVN